MTVFLELALTLVTMARPHGYNHGYGYHHHDNYGYDRHDNYGYDGMITMIMVTVDIAMTMTNTELYKCDIFFNK